MGEIEGGHGVQHKRLNLRFEIAGDLFAEIPEIAEDMDARPTGETAMEFVETLLKSETPEEAITVCAYNLPRRHAVWWGHECLMRVQELWEPGDKEMLELAAAWVAEPDEQRRQAALVAALEVESPTAGTWIAYAAGWSAGSMNGPDLPEVPPAPFLTAKAVNAGVLTILAAVDLESRDKTLASFVKMARQLAEGQ